MKNSCKCEVSSILTRFSCAEINREFVNNALLPVEIFQTFIYTKVNYLRELRRKIKNYEVKKRGGASAETENLKQNINFPRLPASMSDSVI